MNSLVPLQGSVTDLHLWLIMRYWITASISSLIAGCVKSGSSAISLKLSLICWMCCGVPQFLQQIRVADFGHKSPAHSSTLHGFVWIRGIS